MSASNLFIEADHYLDFRLACPAEQCRLLSSYECEGLIYAVPHVEGRVGGPPRVFFSGSAEPFWAEIQRVRSNAITEATRGR